MFTKYNIYVFCEPPLISISGKYFTNGLQPKSLKLKNSNKTELINVHIGIE